MGIKLKYRKVCDTCGGKGRTQELFKHRFKKCPDCSGLGYTEETMEFSYNSEYGHFYSKENEDLVIHYMTAEGLTLNSKLESLNPQSLHFIEERECPECNGRTYIDYDAFSSTDDFLCDCCYNEIGNLPKEHWGKISVETSFTIIGKSENEYRKELLKEGFTENELNSEE